MASGISAKLKGQIGEHLVTAELGRLGVIATPFSGNVPDFDILAHANGATAHIQVKAIKSDSWQFDVRRFLNVELVNGKQVFHGVNTELDRKLICVFVSLGEKLGDDKFYVFRQGWLQDRSEETYQPRKPPKNVASFHWAIWERDFHAHLGKWDLIKRHFKLHA